MGSTPASLPSSDSEGHRSSPGLRLRALVMYCGQPDSPVDLSAHRAPLDRGTRMARRQQEEQKGEVAGSPYDGGATISHEA